MPPANRYQLMAAFAAVDALNALDPRMTDVDGTPRPYELVYGHRMTNTLKELDPEASDALQLAARAHHVERWKIPRHAYPNDRPGYLKWRKDLQRFHAEKIGEVLHTLNFTEDFIERVQFLVQKKKLKQDPETQLLEDAICVVFLRCYAAEFAAEHPDEKVVDILAKTMRKMSGSGLAAVRRSDLDPKVRDLLARASSQS